MKKFIWFLLLAGVVLFHSACGGGAAESADSTNHSSASYLESEGSSTNITKTALDMSRFAGEMKSGVSADVYKTKVARKAPRGINGLYYLAVIYLMDKAIDKAVDKKGKKDTRR